MLAADTGLGLAPWELKLFLKELDLGDDDRVSADRFCGIYTFLASRPPTPAAAPAAAPASGPAEAAAAAPAAPAPAQTDPAPASVPAAPRDEAAEPPSARESSSRAISAQIGLPFPPEFVLDPTGRVPTEKAKWTRESDGSDGSASVGGRWRSADGAGQCASFPFLGAARAPQSRAVCSAKASDPSRRLPNARALASLHAVGVDEDQPEHPNEVSGVFHAFHQLLRFELGIHNEASDKGAGWWRCDKSAYLDLQSVYGADEKETEAVRVFDATDGAKIGSVDVDAVVKRAAIATRLSSDLGGSGSATAAQALLTTFARNHNELAARVASLETDSPIDADVVFQMARHANCAAFRAVVLKDYLPFMRTGQHLRDVPETIAKEDSHGLSTKDSTNETLVGACVSVELDLLMRAVASMAPREDIISNNAEHVAEALAGASGRRCGLGARRSLPKRMVPSETAAVRRARAAGACTLNEFREAHGLPRWVDFASMTAGEEVLSRTLHDLYGGDVDNVELYTGFLCEANVADPGACLTATARETVGKMIGALVSGDAFFRESFLGNDDMSVASFAAGADLGKDATLAGLLEKHAGVTVTGVSAFEVGALAIAKTAEEGDGSA